MTIKISLTKSKRVSRFAKKFPNEVKAIVTQELVAGAEAIMASSKENYVPVDTSALKTSGHVKPPEETRGKVSVTMGYGGPSAPYALTVHEDLNSHHVVGQAKYLETPAKKIKPILKRKMTSVLSTAAKKMAKRR